MTTIAQERGVPFIAPREMRADQGNPEITAWCPKCEQRVVPSRSGLCGWCDTDLSVDLPPVGPHAPASPPPPAADDDEPAEIDLDEIDAELDAEEGNRDEAQPEPVEPPAPAPAPLVAAQSSRPAPTGEQREIVAWRRASVLEWMRENGPATMVEIAAQFDLDKQTARRDVEALRIEGRLVRTGRERVGPAGGRASPEFEVIEPEPEPVATAPAITVHQELTIRYIGSLIDWVSRSAYVRDDGPPPHVFDRIERLLGIADGAA